MTRLLTVREARRTFSAITKGSEAIAVGDICRTRAIIVPLPPWDSWNPKTKRRALRQARAAFRAAINALS